MKAFVVGASGYTGEHVVLALRARGVEVVAHVRADSPRLASVTEPFQRTGATLDHSPWDEAAITSALRREQPDLVFSLLGTTRRRARQEAIAGDIYEAVEGRLTRLLLNAVVTACPRARFVFLSALGTQPNSKSPYYRARAEVEKSLIASGVPYTIVRAPFITGSDRPEARRVERLGAGVTDRLLSVAAALGATELRRRYASLTGRDLAEALVRVALDPSAVNRILEPEELRSAPR